MREQDVDLMQKIPLFDGLKRLVRRLESPFQGHRIREDGGDAERRKRPGRGESSPHCRERQPRLARRDGWRGAFEIVVAEALYRVSLDRDEAADAFRGLVERIVLTPAVKRGEMDATLHGDLGTIPRMGRKRQGERSDRHSRIGNVGLDLVAGGGFEPPTFGL